MAAKAILVLCAQAFLVQSAFSQCLGLADIATPYGLAGRDWGYDGLAYDGLAAPFGLAGHGWAGCGAPAIDYTVTSGGGLPVTSTSAIPPVGVSVASENVYEGILASAGELPFVGTVGVEGVLPTAGAGAINYGCGNGITAMTSDILGRCIAAPAIGAIAPAIGAIAPAAAIASPTLGFGAGIAGPLGYSAGWAGRGCGCGLL